MVTQSVSSKSSLKVGSKGSSIRQLFKGAEIVAKKVAKKWQLKIVTQIGSSKLETKYKQVAQNGS